MACTTTAVVAAERLVFDPPCACGRQGPGGRALPASQCCVRYLGPAPAVWPPDPESLMRSRYSAFVAEDRAHLMRTWHPDHRPATVEFEPGLRWLGLQVQRVRQLGLDAAEVEFVARSRDPSGRAHRLRERSRFVRLPDVGWVYTDGDRL